MNKYWKHLSPEANSGNAPQRDDKNEKTPAKSEETSAKAKAAPIDSNEMINNTGLDHPPANNNEDTDLSEGTHDADAASG